MILGPRTLTLDGKVHKVLSVAEGAAEVEITLRALDSHVVRPHRLSLKEWQRHLHQAKSLSKTRT